MTDTRTCLNGELGTGKEVVAWLIHRVSRRRHGPLVAINCAAPPEQLFESGKLGLSRTQLYTRLRKYGLAAS